jgi:hypothetical protein
VSRIAQSDHRARGGISPDGDPLRPSGAHFQAHRPIVTFMLLPRYWKLDTRQTELPEVFREPLAMRFCQKILQALVVYDQMLVFPRNQVFLRKLEQVFRYPGS